MNIRPFKSLAEQMRLRTRADNGTFPTVDFQAMLDASKGLDLPERLTPKRDPKQPRMRRRGPYERQARTAGRTTHY